MKARFHCSACGWTFPVGEETIGQLLRCPACRGFGQVDLVDEPGPRAESCGNEEPRWPSVCARWATPLAYRTLIAAGSLAGPTHDGRWRMATWRPPGRIAAYP